jgi:hypothetical protein
MAFAFLPRAVAKLVIGMVTVDEVERNMGDVHAACEVPGELWREAWASGLVSQALPLPAHTGSQPR